MISALRHPLSRPEPARRPSARPSLLRYTLGNTMALLWGLGVAYGALLAGKHITSLTIKTTDFVQYYAVSSLILHGHGGVIYDFARLSHVEAAIVYPLSAQQGVLPFLYPPYFALLIAPLSALPYAVAFGLWLAVNCLLLSLVMFAVERQAGLEGRAALIFRLVSICSLPVIMTLWLGQVSIIILALVTGCFVAARSGRPELAGVALAFAAIKPPYVIPFVLLFLIRRDWRVLIAFSITAVCLLLAPIPFLGLSIDGTYLHTLLQVSAWQGQSGPILYHHVMVDWATYAARPNQSFTGLAYLLFPASIAPSIRIALTVLALASLPAIARRCKQLDLPFAVAVLVALLISPHVLDHDLTLLILPLAILLRQRAAATPRLRALWLPIATYFAVAVGSAASSAIPLQLSVLAMSALALWLVVLAFRLPAAAKQPNVMTSTGEYAHAR